jgi:hypothetical protein
MRCFAISIFLFLTLFCSGQADSSLFQRKWNQPHSPLKATIYSAVVPGLGQIYNHKYWKTPIALVGISTCIYFIHTNSVSHQFWKNAYIAGSDNDPNTNPSGIAAGLTNAQLDFNRLLYKKYLDISYLSLIGVYGLQILDAHVDAHLFNFDVSPKLSLRTTPLIHPKFAGLHLSIQF